MFAIAAAAVMAYIPCINNGFIADDYIMLHRLQVLKTDPFYLFEVAPEIFRLTSYAAFAAFKTLNGYNAELFYGFNILLHAVNSALLARLVFEIAGDRKSAFLGALVFAVYHRPQEAVMWVGSMNETLAFFFIAVTLLLWIRRQHAWALVPYSLALFSKESAVVVLPAVVLIDYYMNRIRPWRAYMVLLLPTGLFAAVFLLTLSHNFMINGDIHAFRWHAMPVLLRSLHRLFWPWAYILAILAWLARSPVPEKKAVSIIALLLVLAVLPYIFLIHGDSIPSRHNYLASAVFATALAGVVLRMPKRMLQTVFIGSFVLFNIGYLWIRHDASMERRAAPTTTLREELAKRSPGPVRIVGFAYPSSDIAKAAAVTVPGWQWNQIDLSPPAEICQDCIVLEWNDETRRYTEK